MTETGRNVHERSPAVLIRRGEMVKHFSMSEAIASMSVAFAGLSSGTSQVPERYVTDAPGGALSLLLKPAFADDLNTFGVKMLAQRNSGSIEGIPTITGIVMLVNKVTGELLSIMDGEHITALRTGAASGLATQLLSREDSQCMALFGCGSQGRTQLEAVCTVRDIQRTWVFDTSRVRAESFLEEMKEKVQSEIEFATDLSVLKEVDIICTATPSEKPLFTGADIREGTHINAIGSFKPHMQELGPDLIQSSRTYFDDRDECLKSGDLKRAIMKYGNLAHQFMGEIGELLLGKVPGRISPKETTLFKSVGTAIQDLVVADHIYHQSRIKGFGEEIRLYE